MLVQLPLSNFLFVEKMYPGMVKGTILFLMNWITLGMHYLIYEEEVEVCFLMGLTWKKNMKNMKKPIKNPTKNKQTKKTHENFEVPAINVNAMIVLIMKNVVMVSYISHILVLSF